VRLVSVEVIPYALPFREPYVTARGTLARREMVLLRLRTEEGLVGLGEAVPLSLRGGTALAKVVRELEALGESDELARLIESGELGETAELPEGIEISAPARCAVSTALVDLGDKRAQAGMSATSAGGESPGMAQVKPPARSIPCNATLVCGEPAAVAEDALRWMEEGYSTFKLKLGSGDDVEQVRAVREAVGAEAQIRVDANAAWSLKTAQHVLAELEPLGIQLAEQPVATMEEAAVLARSTSIPLAGDESIEGEGDAKRALTLGAFALTGIKLSKVGGLRLALFVAQAIPAYVSSALDGPVGIAIGARLAAKLWARPWPVAGEPAHGLATQRLFASTIASVECRLEGGMLCEAAGPGLGVEIDEAALDAHRL
jgi:L-Ala-D/L-Glu epimerase